MAYSHIVPYITKDSKLHYVSVDESFDLHIGSYPKQNKKIEGILIENTDNTVAVLINPNSSGCQTQIEMCGKLWYAELQADSISTIIIEK